MIAHARPRALGEGIGLRVPHLREFLNGTPQVPVLEAISENYLEVDSQPWRNLRAVAERYPVILHGVCLGLGGSDAPSTSLVRRIRDLGSAIKAPWISDHCCWSRSGRHHLHDLLPLPYTDDLLRLMIDRARRVQDLLGRPFALENPSTYLTFTRSQMPEWEFINRLVTESGCWLLLDVNNVQVAANNHGFQPQTYLDHVPWDRVLQIHVAGHTVLGDGQCLDTHDHPVSEPVWDLYRVAQERAGGVTAILERDDAIPPLSDLLAEWQHRHARAQP